VSLSIGKAVLIPNPGLPGITVPGSISEIQSIQLNGDGTLTVLVDFWADQASFDDPLIVSFLTKSYQIDEPVSFQAIINTELKTLPDFDLAT